MEARTHLRHGGAPTRRLTVRDIAGRTAVFGITACALVAAAALLFADITTGPQRSLSMSVQPLVQPIPVVAPSTVLTEKPWIGNSCTGSYSRTAIEASLRVPLCDRVGLEISLRTRAVTATATINGQLFKLDNAAWSDPPVGGKHKWLSGFLQHARFLHGPFKTVTFRNGVRQHFTIERVHLVINYGTGREVQTSLTELGYGGWG